MYYSSVTDTSWHKFCNIKEGETKNPQNARMGYNPLSIFGIHCAYRYQSPEIILAVHISKQFVLLPLTMRSINAIGKKVLSMYL